MNGTCPISGHTLRLANYAAFILIGQKGGAAFDAGSWPYLIISADAIPPAARFSDNTNIQTGDLVAMVIRGNSQADAIPPSGWMIQPSPQEFSNIPPEQREVYYCGVREIAKEHPDIFQGLLWTLDDNDKYAPIVQAMENSLKGILPKKRKPRKGLAYKMRAKKRSTQVVGETSE